MIFENQEISVDSLPHAGEADLRRLPAAALRLRYLGHALGSGLAVLLAIFFLSPLFPGWQKIWMAGILAGIAALSLTSRWLIGKGFEREGYALREHDIIHQRGYWWTMHTAVPFARVQHVEIVQGPLAKRYGLCTLRIFTAGSGGGDLSISGIELEEAHRIKAFIAQKAGSDGAA